LLENVHPVTYSIILFTNKKIFTVATPNKNYPQNDRLYAPTNEERRRDKTPSRIMNVQSLMPSAGESQVADSTPG